MNDPEQDGLPSDLPEPIKELMAELGDLLKDIAMHAEMDVDEMDNQPSTDQTRLAAVHMAMNMAARCAELLQAHAKIIQTALNTGWTGDMTTPVGSIAMACTLSLIDQCSKMVTAASKATGGEDGEEPA